MKLQAIAPSTARSLETNSSNDGNPGNGANHNNSRTPEKSRKRTSINVNGACEPCRRGKRKCDGVRPNCGACVKRTLSRQKCEWAQHEGLSRNENLKLNVKMYKEERDSMRTFLSDFITHSPVDATMEDLCRHLSNIGTENLPQGLGDQIKNSIRERATRPNATTTPKTPSIKSERTDSADSMDTAPSMYSSSMSTTSTTPHLDDFMSAQEIDRGSSSSAPYASAESSSKVWDRYPEDLRHDSRRASLTCSKSPETMTSEPERPSSSNSSNAYDILSRCIKPGSQAGNLPTTRPQSQTPQSTKESSHLHIYSHVTTAGGLLNNVPTTRVVDYTIPIYSLQPLWVESDSALSQTIAHFVKLARQRIEQSWDVSSILSTNSVNLDQLLSPQPPAYEPSGEMFNVDTWALNVVRSFGETKPELLIIGYLVLTRRMSWIITGGEQTFNSIPTGLRPTPASRFVPHPAELSFVSFPDLSDGMLSIASQFQEDWIAKVMQHSRLDWPAADSGIRLTQHDPVTGAMMLSKDGEEYISNQENWLFDDGLRSAFPDLKLRTGWPKKPAPAVTSAQLLKDA